MVIPASPESYLELRDPKEGPRGNTIGYPGSACDTLSPRECDTGFELGVGASPVVACGCAIRSKVLS